MSESSYPSWLNELAVFDLETTGINVETDRIVTAHISRMTVAADVTQSFDWLANPGIPIPPQASAVHGITTEVAVRDGRSPREVVAEIVDTLRDAVSSQTPIVAFNAAYDLTLLDREARRHGVTPVEPLLVIDPLIIDRGVDRYRKGKRTLEVTCQHYGVDLFSAHEAAADAQAAGLLALKLFEAHPSLAELDSAALHQQQVDWARQQAESFQAWKRANGDPTFTTSGDWPIRELRLA